MFQGTKNLLQSFLEYNIATVYQKLQNGIHNDKKFNKIIVFYVIIILFFKTLLSLF